MTNQPNSNAWHEEADKLVAERKEALALAGLLLEMGTVSLRAGKPVDALESFNQALILSTKLRLRGTQALAHTHIGFTHKDIGQWNQAYDHFTQALTLYTQLGLLEDQTMIHNEIGALTRQLDGGTKQSPPSNKHSPSLKNSVQKTMRGWFKKP